MHTDAIHKTALVLFSGGQDSTTCLAQALSRYDRVETVAFDYGQRHIVELEARLNVLRELKEKFPHWASKLGADHLLDLAVLGQVSTPHSHATWRSRWKAPACPTPLYRAATCCS